MRNGNDNNSCLFGEQLVSYIYSELPASGRATFEEHLLGCSGCTDEFAAISMSRLSVYEWHRDDFLPLETPVFVIPYSRPVAESERLSWLDVLRGLFSPARLAAAGGAFALSAIAFGFVYVSIMNNGPSIAEVGETVSPPSSQTIAQPIGQTAGMETTPPTYTVVAGDQLGPQTVANASPTLKKAIQAKATKRELNRTRQLQARSPQKAPRLGTFDDAEDTSLRLADLIAGIDTDDF